MRKRKTSHQPNFKATRAVVLGKDGVGKSGIYWLVSSLVNYLQMFRELDFSHYPVWGADHLLSNQHQVQFSPLRVHELL